jgi:MoaA/NifB/PqqE/SkfB family radical SAM enzyme
MTRQLPVVDISRRREPLRTLLTWERGEPLATDRQDLVAERALARGLEIEPDRHNVLVLNYTMACPLSCDFCCYACGPRRTETMDRALAFDLVDQAADLGVFGACSFTGGDPFVYYDDMLAISRRMAQHGLPFTAISACAWATDDDAVDEMLRPLVDAGMTCITASHDPSHEQWVPRANVVRVVSRALALGVRAGVFGTFYERTDLDALFPELADLDGVTLQARPVAFGVGRLKQAEPSHDAYQDRELGGEPTCYRRVYHDVTVFWDGEVYPCCSVYNRATPGISYGNVYATSLREIWDRIEDSLFLRVVKRTGFRDLYALLGQLDPELARELPDPSGADGACRLCNRLMSDATTSSRVHAVLAEEEQRRVARVRLQ